MMVSGVLTPLDCLSCYFTLNLYRCADALHECEVWVCHHILDFLLHNFASPGPIQMVTVHCSTSHYVAWYIHLCVLQVERVALPSFNA
jgi:hypothetical protein